MHCQIFKQFLSKSHPVPELRDALHYLFMSFSVDCAITFVSITALSLSYLHHSGLYMDCGLVIVVYVYVVTRIVEALCSL